MLPGVGAYRDCHDGIHAILIAHEDATLVQDKAEVIKRLANLGQLDILENGEKVEKSLTTFVGDIEIYLPLADLIDFDAEKKRLTKEISELEGYFEMLEKKLSNKGFVKNAPEEIIKKERMKMEETQQKLEKLKKQLIELGK